MSGGKENGVGATNGRARGRGDVSVDETAHRDAGGDLSGEGEVYDKGNTRIESESARWDRELNGGGSAWRGPCAECAVRQVRTPTEGGACCNGDAHRTSREMHSGVVHGTTRACARGAAHRGRHTWKAHSPGGRNLRRRGRDRDGESTRSPGEREDGGTREMGSRTGGGAICTGEGPHMKRKRKRVAKAPKGCGGEGPRGRCIAGEPKDEERKDGGGRRGWYSFKNGKICPYMENGMDCQLEHGGEKGAGGRRKGREASSSVGAGEGGQEEPEGRMRARALSESRTRHGQTGTGGRVQAQRGSPHRSERLGDQRHGGSDTKVGQTGQFREDNKGIEGRTRKDQQQKGA